MMAAVLAEGTTVLDNAACEPEIVALAEYLDAHGAHITGAGTSTITIHGLGKNGRISEGTAQIIPDRIEAGSFVILAAATKSKLTITRCNPDHLRIPLEILETIGVHTTTTKDTITVHPAEHITAHDIVTHEYPGFPTDLQAPMTVLLTQATGHSLVRETIYDGRLFYTDTLNTLGAKITLLDSYRVEVNGPTGLRGKTVASPDIRAGIALVIAGLMAKGETTINNIYQIDRGYEHIEQRLAGIGADIVRVAE
jgi:UDP-N-acetylglucosamine 1-carboxyvinyltransferase